MIAKMLQLGDRRPEFVATAEAQLRRHLQQLRALPWREIPEFANAAIHDAIQAGAEQHCQGTVGYVEDHAEHTRGVRKLLRQRRDIRERLSSINGCVDVKAGVQVGTVSEAPYQQAIKDTVDLTADGLRESGTSDARREDEIDRSIRFEVSSEHESLNRQPASGSRVLRSDVRREGEINMSMVSFFGSERYRELVEQGFTHERMYAVQEISRLAFRLKIVSRWLTQRKRAYWNEVTELRCDGFMRAAKANDTFT
eukprot:304203-Pyramimonas_sp.AAC.1